MSRLSKALCELRDKICGEGHPQYNKVEDAIECIAKNYPESSGGGCVTEYIETTPHSTYENTVNIPISGAEIHAKVNAGIDVVIKFTIVRSGLTYTLFARLSYFREDGILSFTAHMLNNKMCYRLDVSDDPGGYTASYAVLTLTTAQ